MKQLFQNGKTLFKVVETYTNSPAGYLITCSAIFLTGAFSGKLLQELIMPIFFKILNVARKESPETATEPSKPTTRLVEDEGPYQYLPLMRINEIRLLEVMPQSEEDPTTVDCKLHHYPLQEIPAYMCLSYTWGKDPKDTHSIRIDGKKFLTSRKVHEMLLDVSTWEEYPLMVWVDAICINQDDIEEKTRQVCMMRTIFTWANLVEVWLGDGDDFALLVEVIDDASITFCSTMAGLSNEEWLEKIRREPPRNLAGYRLNVALEELRAAGGYNGVPGADLDSSSIKDLEKTALEYSLPRCREKVFEKYSDPSNHHKLAALVKLLSNPWWTRVWVIQEVLVSANVRLRYGKAELPLDIIALATIVFNSPEGHSLMTSARKYNWNHNMKGLGTCGLMHGLRSHLSSGESVSLSDLLSLTTRFEATDPRDKVYALLGVTNNIPTQALLPDYGKSVEQVYIDVTQHFITNGEAFFAMKYAGVGHVRMMEELPSWVPDWTTLDKYLSPFDTGVVAPIGYSASADAVPEIRLNLGTSTPIIDVKGVEIDTVSALGVVLFDKNTPASNPVISRETTIVSFEHLRELNEFNLCVVQFFEKAKEMTEVLGETYFNGQPLQEAFWRTCLGDRVGTRPAPDEYEDLVHTFPKYYSKLVDQFNEMLETLETEEDPEDSEDPVMDRFPADDFFEKMDSFYQENMNEMSKWTLDGSSLEAVKDFVTNSPRAFQFFGSFQPFGRNFCVTSKGYIGIVPPKTEVGDKVCILFGGKSPFLLRDAGGGKHVLVGECYVHGIMNGEALPQVGEATWYSLC